LGSFGTRLVIEPSPGQLSGDTGLLPIRQFDQRVGLTRANARALDDPRDPALTEHTFLEMVRSRVYGILAGFGVPAMYEVCEGLRVSYTFGLSTNAVLQRETEGLPGPVSAERACPTALEAPSRQPCGEGFE
jgi:hypothetical protein